MLQVVMPWDMSTITIELLLSFCKCDMYFIFTDQIQSYFIVDFGNQIHLYSDEMLQVMMPWDT